MKNLISFLIVFIQIIGVKAQTYNLSVINGYGSGNYQVGDTIDVFANPNPLNTVFDHWTSSFPSLITLPSFNEYHIRVIMPSNNVTLSPNYQSYPSWNFVHTQIIGKELYYYFPAGMKGIIQCFHGAGGSATGWTDSLKAVENLNFCRYAVAHGYGLFISESNNRTSKQWNNNIISTTNPDIVSIYQMIDTLISHNVLNGNEKMFAVSHSQGSGFNSIISYIKNFCASALGGVAGRDTVFYYTNTPTYWQASKNDTSADPLRISKIISAFNTLSGRGIDAEYHILNSTKIFPKRFERIPGIDSVMAVNIYNDLNNAGYLDGNSYFNTNPRVNSSYINSVTSVPTIFQSAIDDQVTVAFTEHKFYSDYNDLIIDFFDNHLCTTTGIDDHYNENDKLSIYPNPANNYIFVHCPKGYQIYSMTGLLLKQSNQTVDQISISDLPSGLYLLKTEDKIGRFMKSQ